MSAEITRAHRTDHAAAESTAVSGGASTGTQPADVQSVAAEQSARGPAALFSATARARPALDVRQLRHPSEPSRFALAASASILLVGGGLLIVLRLTGIFGLAAIGATVLTALGLVWWAVQVHRAKLLGGAARVTPETFPMLSMAAGEVKQQVGYTQPVEIFVVAEADDPVRLTSFFGTRVLLMKGDLVAELVKPENRPQLDFILATFFGKLKVRALAWAPLLIAIDALGLPRVLNFLIAPWERATVYTGDQVAAACCGSLDESITALNRLLVGKDLARSVGMTGLMSQAASVRRRWLPRLQQLYSSYPHLTNRYLNLLSFAGQSTPGQARAFRDRLHPTTDFRVQDVSARLTRLRKRGPRRWLAAASIEASAALLGLVAIGIFLVPQNDLVPVANIWWGRMPWVVETTPGPAATAPASPGPSASPTTPSDPVAVLESHAPPAFASTCSGFAPQTAIPGLVAAITCGPTGGYGPASVQYYQYANTADMNAAFNDAAYGVTEGGTCDQAGQRGTYNFTSGPGPGPGLWACYYHADNEARMIWTDTKLGILAVASDPAETPQELNSWFFSTADTGPD